MSKTFEIRSCEVCGSSRLDSVLDLGNHPLCDDLLPIDSSAICDEYPIEILFCSACRTAHQRFQVDKRLLFPRHYHYRARLTSDVVGGMRSLVAATESRLGALQGKVVLDIGCNDGSLLDIFREKGSKTIGIEPTAAGVEARQRGHALVEDYLSPDVAMDVTRHYGKPDIITFTNVFAHIESLVEALRSLQSLMADHTVLVIENHYLGAIIEKSQFDTFYHEHPRTYSLTSFMRIASTLGRSIVDVAFPSRYGGNIRVVIGPLGEKSDAGGEQLMDKITASEAAFGSRLAEMPSQIDRWKSRARGRIDEMLLSGRVSCKAFPGRAAILVKLLGLGLDEVDAVYEKPGSMKVGKRVPGTFIPILSDEELFKTMVSKPALLNLAWHIPSEIHDYLRQHGYQGRVVNVCEPADMRAF